MFFQILSKKRNIYAIGNKNIEDQKRLKRKEE